jgi:hypothetical protein
MKVENTTRTYRHSKRQCAKKKVYGYDHLQKIKTNIKTFLLVYATYTGGVHCDFSIYTYIVPWFGSSPPLISLFPHSPS